MTALHVRLTDGSEHDVDQKPADYVRFERQFGIPMSSIDDASASYEHMMFLGFLGLKRKNIYHGTFEDFIDVVDDISAVPKATG